MLLERVRFSLDGLECDKIGVSFEAYNGQPNFCGMPFMSCLHNQLWNFWEVSYFTFFYEVEISNEIKLALPSFTIYIN